MIPIFNTNRISWYMFGAILVIPAEICDELSCEQGKVNGHDQQTDWRRQWQYSSAWKANGVKINDQIWSQHSIKVLFRCWLVMSTRSGWLQSSLGYPIWWKVYTVQGQGHKWNHMSKSARVLKVIKISMDGQGYIVDPTTWSEKKFAKIQILEV